MGMHLHTHNYVLKWVWLIGDNVCFCAHLSPASEAVTAGGSSGEVKLLISGERGSIADQITDEMLCEEDVMVSLSSLSSSLSSLSSVLLLPLLPSPPSSSWLLASTPGYCCCSLFSAMEAR